MTLLVPKTIINPFSHGPWRNARWQSSVSGWYRCPKTTHLSVRMKTAQRSTNNNSTIDRMFISKFCKITHQEHNHKSSRLIDRRDKAIHWLYIFLANSMAFGSKIRWNNIHIDRDLHILIMWNLYLSILILLWSYNFLETDFLGESWWNQQGNNQSTKIHNKQLHVSWVR